MFNTTVLDVRLEVGSETTAVRVSAEAEELAVRDGPLRGGNFLPSQVSQLPLIGLSPLSLARTLPGVVQTSGSALLATSSAAMIAWPELMPGAALVAGSVESVVKQFAELASLGYTDVIALAPDVLVLAIEIVECLLGKAQKGAVHRVRIHRSRWRFHEPTARGSAGACGRVGTSPSRVRSASARRR